MVRINLNQTYQLNGDKSQWTLSERVGDRYIITGYYTELLNLLREYVAIRCRTSECQDILELLQYQKTVVADLERISQGLEVQVKLKG